MKNLLKLLILLLVLSCKTDPKPKPTPKPAPPKKETPKPVNPDKLKWEKFWGDFTAAVKENDAEKIADMTHFPFKMESLNKRKAMTRDKFIANFSKIYDDKTKETFLNAGPNFAEFALKKEKTAKEYNLPLNQKIYGVQVDYKSKENPNPKQKSIAFYFAKENGTYKVYTTRIE